MMAQAQITFEMLLNFLLLLMALSLLAPSFLALFSSAKISFEGASNSQSLALSSLNSGIIYCSTSGTTIGNNIIMPYAAGERNTVGAGDGRAPTVNPGASGYERIQTNPY